MSPLAWALDHPELRVVWVAAEGVAVGAADDVLRARLAQVAGDPELQGLDDHTRAAVRDLLRGHGYKPAGRGKPASEFLAGAAASDRFPEINNVVDVNNLVSLESGWPISIFDLDAATASDRSLELRHGRQGESFVFNPAGQAIDIGGLVVVARSGGEAIGNPVKDSMATKITPSTRRVLAVVYTSRALCDAASAARWAGRFEALLVQHAAAETVRSGVLDQGR